jgi:RimJ/RimL family protein N-acetyltransferase
MSAHRLSDGRQIWIRPIEPSDAWRLQDGLRHLSAETIHRRFLGAKPRLSPRELRYLTEVDQVNHVALVAIVVDTGQLVAVARCVRLVEDPRTAEWAIVVGDPMQRKGLGTVLVQALAEAAMDQGIHRFTGTVAGENAAVLRLLARVTDHFEAGRPSCGVREVVVDLQAFPPPWVVAARQATGPPVNSTTRPPMTGTWTRSA